MDMSTRYHIIADDYGGVMVFDSATGAIQHPVCWQDLVAYFNYLVGQGRMDESQKLLADSIAGKKPITRILEYASSPLTDIVLR